MIAVISDIHSNAEALSAVLDAISSAEVDELYVLGDIVGYGADPDAVVTTVASIERATVLAGNHDLAATGRFDARWFNDHARAAIEWTASSMTAGTASTLAALEPRGQGACGLCVHGSVVDPAAEYVVNADDADASFASEDFERCFFGHTHLPTAFVRDAGGVVTGFALHDGQRFTIPEGHRAMLNPGSVGQPRDGDPRASYMLYEPSDASATVRRVAYDVPAAQAKIRAAGLPEILADRLAAGR